MGRQFLASGDRVRAQCLGARYTRVSAGAGVRGGRECGGDVGVAEVVPFAQQCLSRGLGQGVREAVPEVQAGFVAAALAEIAVCVTGGAGLVAGHWFDAQLRDLHEFVKAAAGDRVPAGVDDDRGLMTTAVSSQFAAEMRLSRALSMAWAICEPHISRYANGMNS